MKKAMLILLVGLMAIISACGNTASKAASNSKTFTIGFGVGLYEDQFRKGILPILEQKGYDVKIQTFSQAMQINPAMKEGTIDASVFQSTAYMEGINKELDTDMTGIVFVPSAPQGLYSTKHTSLDQIQDGATIAVPNDPVNQERAVRILEQLGWVTVAADAGTIDFNLNSVSPGKYNLKLEALDAAQILASLPDVDYGVINGNYITAAGQKITDALQIENTPEQHRIIVSVPAADQDTEWAKDLKAAYESPEFAKVIQSDERYDGFILPDAWK